MLIATLIAPETLEKGEISSAQDCLAQAGAKIERLGEMVDNRSVDIYFDGDPARVRRLLEAACACIDIAVQPSENRRKKLLISDMDSTMITVECIDELAGYAGIKDQIAEVTERAMRGELDFEEALRSRVALLKDLKTAAIQQCLDEKIKLMPGARTLVRTMNKLGARTILVSGGFTKFADPVANAIGFEEYHANVLDEKSGLLTGALAGEIVDASRKAEILRSAVKAGRLAMADTLAVGDGANDIPMIELAGLGVAYHAKLKAAQAADAAIRHNDLTALLYIQGISRAEWLID